MNSKTLSALLGLIGACENGSKTDRTDTVIISALSGSANADEIKAEKFRVSPNCRDCKYPCGNTSDFDLSKLDGEPDEIRQIKQEILSKVESVTKSVSNVEKLDILPIIKALSYLRYNLTAEVLNEVLSELNEYYSEVKYD